MKITIYQDGHSDKTRALSGIVLYNYAPAYDNITSKKINF